MQAALQMVRQEWAGQRPEMIHRRFLFPPAPFPFAPMAFPLPPAVGAPLGEEIAHEPQIPLYYEEEREIRRLQLDIEAIEKDPTLLMSGRPSTGRRAIARAWPRPPAGEPIAGNRGVC